LTPIVSQLRQVPSLVSADIKELDYSDEWAKEILTKNGLIKLPAVILNNNVAELAKFLKPTPENKFNLELGATFDPTAERSEKWFLLLDKKVLEEIKKDSYMKGNKDAKITWIEYSDLECPFCAKLHNSWTPEALEKKYWDDLNQVFQSFPLDIHKNALPWAEALECLGKEKWSEAYYELIHISFKNEKSDQSFLIDEAVKLWANKESITKCIEDKTFADKINKQQSTWTKEFRVTWTPWNVLINNETWEYEVISWAYPADYFINIIDKLLK
jgi:protein-disulfide isomerase